MLLAAVLPRKHSKVDWKSTGTRPRPPDNNNLYS